MEATSNDVSPLNNSQRSGCWARSILFSSAIEQREDSELRATSPRWKFRIKVLDREWILVPATGVATITPEEFFKLHDKNQCGLLQLHGVAWPHCPIGARRASLRAPLQQSAALGSRHCDRGACRPELRVYRHLAARAFT